MDSPDPPFLLVPFQRHFFFQNVCIPNSQYLLPRKPDVTSDVCLSSVQSLSRVWLFATPWIAAHQASLSITNSQSLLKLMSIKSVMPSIHLILCRPLLLPPIPPSIRVFSNETTFCIRWTKYWSFSFSVSPSYVYLMPIPHCFGYYISLKVLKSGNKIALFCIKMTWSTLLLLRWILE